MEKKNKTVYTHFPETSNILKVHQISQKGKLLRSIIGAEGIKVPNANNSCVYTSSFT